jgi:hypothetical protein
VTWYEPSGLIVSVSSNPARPPCRPNSIRVAVAGDGTGTGPGEPEAPAAALVTACDGALRAFDAPSQPVAATTSTNRTAAGPESRTPSPFAGFPP